MSNLYDDNWGGWDIGTPNELAILKSRIHLSRRMMHLFNGNTNFHSFILFDQMTEQYRLPGIYTDRLFIWRSITYRKSYCSCRRHHHHHHHCCVCHNIYAVVRNNNNHHNNIIILCITLPIKWNTQQQTQRSDLFYLLSHMKWMPHKLNIATTVSTMLRLTDFCQINDDASTHAYNPFMNM